MTNLEWFYEHYWFMAEPNDVPAPENGVSDADADVTSEKRSKTEHDGLDSREKLLEDANALAIDYWDRRRTWGDANALKKDVIALLDRQADIVRRECADCAEGMGAYADSLCDPLKERIAELTAERDNLARDLEACEREREEYRALCGKMLGVAQELRVVLEAWEGMS